MKATRRRLIMGLAMALVLTTIVGQGPVPARAGDEPPVKAGRVHPTAYRPLPLGAIRPAGWLEAQLKVQASGLSGYLGEFWPDIKDSAWIGGKAEGWERVPYWLDGVVPLAYLVDDARLQAQVKTFIDAILERQQPDGWLGPIGDSAGHKPYDVWPLFPLFKAFTQYQEATGDPRIIPALLRCARKMGQVMDREPLYSWARMRAADFVVSLLWLHDRTGEGWLPNLARKAYAQSHDWQAQFDHFAFTGKTLKKFELDTHGVNTGMALKYGGIHSRLTGDDRDRRAVFTMLDRLDQYHGQATGIFTCDEHLAGRSPSQGTELCTVVEAMYSLELLAAVTGDVRLGDRLERLAFNALPATFKKDMTAHQYDQQCNQVICRREGEHVYVNNGPDANLYGLEPNFGCCTANMHQGWPKLTSHLWMATRDGGLAAIAYAPCTVRTTVGGKPVVLEVRTEYPFRDEVKIALVSDEDVEVPLSLRVPSWVERAELRPANQGRIEGRPGTVLEHRRRGSGRTELTLRLISPVRLHRGYNDAVAIERGPLVYALSVGARWKKLKDNPRFADWEVYPTTPWNYALEIDRGNPAASVSFEERPLTGPPFSPDSAPVVARVKGRRLPGWGLDRGAAAPPPRSPVSSEAVAEELTLNPYGCTDLRVTEMPTLGPAH